MPMKFIFTRIKKQSYKTNTDNYKEVNTFINKALNYDISPTTQSINNIMAFANSYYYSESSNIEKIEQFLN